MKKQFPIFFWCGRANADLCGEKEKADWLDAGFTRLLLGVGDLSPEGKKKTLALLDWCSEKQIDCILVDPRVALHAYGIRKDNDPYEGVLPPDYEKNVKAAAADFAAHPAVYGFDILDEPGWQAYAPCVNAARVVRAVTGKEPFINQKPYYVGVERKLRTFTYPEFIEKLVRESGISCISVDHYGGVSDGKTTNPNYWYTLQADGETAKKTGTDLWCVVCSVPHYTYCPETYADIRFQVNAALAHGAKAISYFTLDTPRPGGGGESNYRSGPINWWGERTPMYTYLRDVNRELQGRWGERMLSLELDRVTHFPCAPHVACKAFEHDGTVRAIVAQKGGEEPHVLVSEFTHRETGEPYVFFTNASLTDSIQIRIWYEKAVRTYSYRLDGTEVPAQESVDPDTGAVVTDLWLAPGQGELFRLE